jgi:chromosome partitioning protein
MSGSLPSPRSPPGRKSKIRESHELSRPMIYLDPKHKLTQEFVSLHGELQG